VADLRRYHPAFDEGAREAVRVERSLAARDVPGGTAPRRVAAATDAAAERVAAGRAAWAALPVIAR
jgi:argininosuccinate lyase